MPAWQSVGPQRFYVDGNLYAMELHGDVTLSEITEILQPQEDLLARYDWVLTLCDARDVRLPSPDVRRYLAMRGKRIDMQRLSVVVISHSVLLRAAVRLVERATMLLTGDTVHTTFVASEAEAEAWLAAQRQRRPGKPRKP